MQRASSNLRVGGFPERWRAVPSSSVDADAPSAEPAVVVYGEFENVNNIIFSTTRRFTSVITGEIRDVPRAERGFPVRWMMPAAVAVDPAATTTTQPLLQLTICSFLSVPDDEMCSICMETNGDTPSMTWSFSRGCQCHRFHSVCIQRWAVTKTTCPLCRSPLV